MATLTLRSITKTPKININDWVIKKKYLFNPKFNGDTPYSFDFYYRMARAGSSVKKGRIPTDTDCRYWAVQEVLHQQTNYNYLIYMGLYRLPRAIFVQVMTQWYNDRARENPTWSRWITLELERHIQQYDNQKVAGTRQYQGADIRVRRRVNIEQAA